MMAHTIYFPVTKETFTIDIVEKFVFNLSNMIEAFGVPKQGQDTVSYETTIRTYQLTCVANKSEGKYPDEKYVELETLNKYGPMTYLTVDFASGPRSWFGRITEMTSESAAGYINMLRYSVTFVVDDQVSG